MRRQNLLFSALLCATLVGCGGGSNNNDVLVVGLECDYAPFNWTSPEASDYTLEIKNADGYADGYDIQIAKYLGEKLNKEVVVKKIAWDSLIPSLNLGDINCIIAGMSYSEERDLSVDFTSNYYTSEMTVIVRGDSELVNIDNIQDLSGYKVGSQLGTLTDSIIDQIDGVNHVTPYETFATAALAVASGAIDAMTAEYPVAKAICQANPSLSVVTFTAENGFSGLDENELGVAVAVKEGNKELQDAINGALDDLSIDQRRELMDGALNRAPSQE